MSHDSHAMTPSQIAKKYGVGIHKVLRWIRLGEMRAINVATDFAGRPRWVVTPDALVEFERRRASQPAMLPRQRRRNKTHVIEYF